MKKLIAIFMVTMMLVLAVGCSSNKGKRDPVLSEDLTFLPKYTAPSLVWLQYGSYLVSLLEIP